MKRYYLQDKNGKNEIVEVGKTRVILTSDRHGQSTSDPLYGSRHQCLGTVVQYSSISGEPLEVEWDNGHTNTYHNKDLQFFRDEEFKSNPNFTFKHRKGTVEDKPAEKVDKEPAKAAMGDSAASGDWSGVKIKMMEFSDYE